MTGPIAVERRGAVAVIRYAHPPRNFMTARMLHELRRAWMRLERDRDVRVIVLTGAGRGDFILHTELAEIRAMLASVPPLPRPLLAVAVRLLRAVAWLLGRSPRLADRVLSARTPRALVRTALLEMMILFDAIERSPKITVAAIDGSCVGGGLELALCFDHRVMIDDPAFRIGCPEVLIGLVPGFGGSQRLTGLVGTSRALELLLTGALLTPREAAAAGLVARAIPPAAFARELDALVAALARRPPPAAAAIKRAVRRGGARSLGRGLALELCEVATVARSPACRAGLDAYDQELARQLARPVAEQPSIGELAAWIERASFEP